jgi:DHA1 family inner membrane transport protein
VVILTMHDAPALVRDLLDCGAAAYLVKSIARDELIAAIRSVSRASGNVLLSIPRATVESLERQQEQRGMLSKRELEVFGAFTYIAFTLTQVSGFATSTVPWLLVLFGVGTFAGNFLGGKAADRSLDKSLLVILALLTAVLTAFALTAHNQVLTVISLFLMGTVGLATAPGLQLRIMRYAEDAPTMASGANIAAFNVGNALGAWLSGLALAAGLGFVSPLWVGAAVNLVGLVVLAGGTAAARRHQPPVTSAAPQDAPQAVTT